MLITMPILESYYHYYSLDGQGIESVPFIHYDIKCHWQTNIHASVDRCFGVHVVSFSY